MAKHLTTKKKPLNNLTEQETGIVYTNVDMRFINALFNPVLLRELQNMKLRDYQTAVNAILHNVTSNKVDIKRGVLTATKAIKQYFDTGVLPEDAPACLIIYDALSKHVCRHESNQRPRVMNQEQVNEMFDKVYRDMPELVNKCNGADWFMVESMNQHSALVSLASSTYILGHVLLFKTHFDNKFTFREPRPVVKETNTKTPELTESEDVFVGDVEDSGDVHLELAEAAEVVHS